MQIAGEGLENERAITQGKRQAIFSLCAFGVTLLHTEFGKSDGASRVRVRVRVRVRITVTVTVTVRSNELLVHRGGDIVEIVEAVAAAGVVLQKEWE